jgi:hypothetical protein
MAHRTTEAQNAVREMAERAGARVSIDQTGGHHQVAVVEFAGLKRKYFFANSGEVNAHKAAARRCRKLLRTMGAQI